MGLAAVFKARSRGISREIALISGRSGVLTAVPRLSIELLFVFSALALIVFLISLGYPSDKAIPLMGIILVGAIRMVPAVSRTLGALANAKFSSGFVRDLVETRKVLEQSQRPLNPDSLQFRREIVVQNLEFRYGARVVLRDINLTLPKGAYVSIVGRSGEGKSTLLDLIIGLQPASAGSFLCDGKKFDPFSSQSFRNMIGYVPQSVSLFDDSLAFNISLQDTPDLDHLDRVLVAANLKEFAMELPDGVRTSLGESGIRVSGGQRQRIGIARALFRNPEILILDEATSSLDSVTETSLTEEIQKLRGKLTILLVAHRLSTVKMSDCIYVLSGGEVVEKGTHEELLARAGMYSSLAASTLDTENANPVQAA
jgi:ATP-binding cassette, subfamily B, bacterial PglK